MSETLPQQTRRHPQVTQVRARVRRSTWRKQVLYLGLAAMETCWLYPWLLFALGSGVRSAPVPFAAILITVLVAFFLTRSLDRRAMPLPWQRFWIVVMAVVWTLLLLRFYVYNRYAPTDLAWLARFVWEVGNVMQRIHSSLILALASLLLWWRGIQLAQRDLGLQSIGFSFRVGIIAFLWLFLAGILGVWVDATPFAFAYFALGLVVLGLARIEEVWSNRIGVRSPFDASWTGLLIAAALLVVALSLLAARVFSVQNIAALLRQMRPALTALARLASPLLLAMAWILQLVLTFLIRVFGAALGQSPEAQDLEGLNDWIEDLRQLQESGAQQGLLATILQVLKWGLIGLVVVSALAAIAVSIGRIRHSDEDGRAAEFDSVLGDDGAGQNVRDALESRWRRWREELRARLARLRGEEYSLATIRQIYASLVRLAASSGLLRQDAETPYEYSTRLQMVFPESEGEIKLITQAYVQAHYGERSSSPQYVGRVRDAWRTIRTRQEQRDRS